MKPNFMHKGKPAAALWLSALLLLCTACTPVTFSNGQLRRDPPQPQEPGLTSPRETQAAEPGGDEVVVITEIQDEPVPLASLGGTNVRAPSTGSVTYSSGGATVDASNTSQGYVMCKFEGSASRIKVLITKNGGRTYQYNLNTNGAYEVFPLTSGDGTYNIAVYKNVQGDQYATVLSENISVRLDSSTIPFLYPNQYVNYNAGTNAVSVGASLSSGASSQLDVVSNVYNYVVNNISYDTAKANSVKSGYLPSVDNILSSGQGICFDYAAVMATMLRTQDIPTRLEVGYVSGGAYHAWLSVYIDEVGWVNDAIYFDGTSWKLMDPTFASSGGQNSATMQYIGNGSNYSTQYLY